MISGTRPLRRFVNRILPHHPDARSQATVRVNVDCDLENHVVGGARSRSTETSRIEAKRRDKALRHDPESVDPKHSVYVLDCEPGKLPRFPNIHAVDRPFERPTVFLDGARRGQRQLLGPSDPKAAVPQPAQEGTQTGEGGFAPTIGR
jgi:hypothetical protein